MPELTARRASRFDYVAFDETSTATQRRFYAVVCAMEDMIHEALPEGRYKSLALTALEEFYTWIGKAIRDQQLEHQRRGEGQKDPWQKV